MEWRILSRKAERRDFLTKQLKGSLSLSAFSREKIYFFCWQWQGLEVIASFLEEKDH